MVGRSGFAFERFGSPRHSSHAAQLFSLGGYTFMKNTFTILLSGLLLCGCSQKQAASTAPASDFIQAGRDIKCNRGSSVLHVDKRDGNSLTGIRYVLGAGTSSEEVTTADTGTLTPLAQSKDGHIFMVQLVLHSWKDKYGAHDGQDTSIALDGRDAPVALHQ